MNISRSSIAALAAPVIMALVPGCNNAAKVNAAKATKQATKEEYAAEEVRVVSNAIQLVKDVCLGKKKKPDSDYAQNTDVGLPTCVSSSTASSDDKNELYRRADEPKYENQYIITIPRKNRENEVVGIMVLRTRGHVDDIDVLSWIENPEGLKPGSLQSNGIRNRDHARCYPSSAFPSEITPETELDCSTAIRDADVLK